MKKLFNFVLILVAVVVIVLSILFIREYILLEQQMVYNLPKIFKNHDIDTIKTVYPDIQYYQREGEDTRYAYLERNGSIEFMCDTFPNSRQFANCALLINESCTDMFDSILYYYRKIGLIPTIPGKTSDLFIYEDDYSEFHIMSYYQPLGSNILSRINCSYFEDDLTYFNYLEITDTKSFAKIENINESDIWNELWNNRWRVDEEIFEMELKRMSDYVTTYQKKQISRIQMM